MKQRTEGNNTYVLLQDSTRNTPLGWVNVKDVTSQNIGNQTKATGQYKVSQTNNGLYSIAWGTKINNYFHQIQLLVKHLMLQNHFMLKRLVFIWNCKQSYWMDCSKRSYPK